MKFLIASDLHGSSYYAKKIVDKMDEEGADKLIFLGDIYNHGPRNPLPKEYDPMKVSETLNAIKDKMIVVKGNCDSAVDTMISDFDFIENVCLVVGGKTVYLTHGHVHNKDVMPKTKFDLVIYGHFHTGFIEEIGGTIIANTGSLSLPKNNTKNSYIILDEEKLTLKDIDGTIIKSINL